MMSSMSSELSAESSIMAEIPILDIVDQVKQDVMAARRDQGWEF